MLSFYPLKKKLRIFTWHIHGSYLCYLSQGNYDIYIPVNQEKNEGYYGRGETFSFGENVIEVAAEEVKNLHFDCILFQTNKNFLVDQYEILSEEQRKLPRIYLEHDPPTKNPTDTRHVMNDPDVIMVHVTHFNRLMWQNDVPVVKVIDHGVIQPSINYDGKIEKGIVVVNHLHQRGRKLGADIFNEVSKKVPLDLIGMGTKEYGGLGEVLHPNLPQFINQYRFFFNPIRYTSLGLAVIEAMMIGIPVVALATTEYVTVLKDDFSGFIHTDIDYLTEKMKLLLQNKNLAKEIGMHGKKTAEKRFNIQRFVKDWEELFQFAVTYKTIYEKENSFY
ncbi:MAG: glycosyltransferase family 4 protein [Chitinophagaceae bacterium]